MDLFFRMVLIPGTVALGLLALGCPPFGVAVGCGIGAFLALAGCGRASR